MGMIINTIRGQLYSLFLIFILFIVISLIASLIVVYDHFADENYINLINEQFFLVQQITESAVSERVDPSTIENVNKFELGNQILKEGGIYITEEGNEYYVAPFRGETEILNSLSQNWQTYRQDLDQILNHPAGDPNHEIMENALLADSLVLSKNIEAIASRIETQSNAKHIWLIYLQVLFLLLVIPLTIWGFTLVRQRVVKPFSSLNSAAQRIQKGILNEPLVLAGEDEIAQLASSFDQMRMAVLANQTDLERRIEMRTSEILTAFEFSQEIVSQHDINALVQSAIAKSRTLMRAKDASLCLVTPDGCSVELASTTSAQSSGQKLVQPIGDNLPDMVVSSGQTRISYVSSFGCAFLRHTPEDQCLSASLHVGEQVIGAMCVTREKDQPFSKEESRAFTLLTNSAAVAILNARYQEEARQRARDAAVLSERERLASELHDNLAQTLNLVNLKVSQLHTKVVRPADLVAQDDVEAVRSNVQAAIEQVRMLASEMASATRLHEDDFLTQLELRLKEFEAASGTRVELTGTELPLDRLSALAQTQLLMIIGEALTNIQRHAEAGQVGIHFSLDQDSLHTIIEDDGKGFQPESVPEDQHLGLRIMHTRAKRSGGSLNLVSSPGAGTRVTVTFPLTAQEPG